jgi:hypothetical protein
VRLIMAALFLALSGAAFAATTAPSGFPRDAVSLSALDTQQLRIVRRAGAQCWHSGQGGLGAKGPITRACIITGSEAMIASLKDPALKSFHDALPMHARYDEYRPAYFWQRLVKNP